jgi:hypothetical protein
MKLLGRKGVKIVSGFSIITLDMGAAALYNGAEFKESQVNTQVE